MLRFLGSLSERKAVLCWPRHAGASGSQNLELVTTVSAAVEGVTLSRQPTGNDEMCWEDWAGRGGQTDQPSRVGRSQVLRRSAVRLLQPAVDGKPECALRLRQTCLKVEFLHFPFSCPRDCQQSHLVSKRAWFERSLTEVFSHVPH